MLEEILVVLAYSTRTQFVLCLSVILPIVVLILGEHFAETLAFPEPFSYLANALRPIILMRYEQAAVGLFISLVMLSAKLYFKDRKRILGDW